MITTHAEVVELITDEDELLGYGVAVTHIKEWRHGKTTSTTMLPEVHSTRTSAYYKADSIVKATAGSAR